MLVDGCRLLQLFFCFIPKYVKRNPTSLSRIKTKILLLLLDILDETLLCFAYHYTQITKMIFSHILFLKVFFFLMSLKQIWSKQTKQKQAIPPSPFSLKKKKKKQIQSQFTSWHCLSRRHLQSHQYWGHFHWNRTKAFTLYYNRVSLFHLFTFNESKFINIYSPWSMNPQTGPVELSLPLVCMTNFYFMRNINLSSLFGDHITKIKTS